MMVRLIFLTTLLGGVASQMTSGEGGPEPPSNYSFTIQGGEAVKHTRYTTGPIVVQESGPMAFSDFRSQQPTDFANSHPIQTIRFSSNPGDVVRYSAASQSSNGGGQQQSVPSRIRFSSQASTSSGTQQPPVMSYLQQDAQRNIGSYSYSTGQEDSSMTSVYASRLSETNSSPFQSTQPVNRTMQHSTNLNLSSTGLSSRSSGGAQSEYESTNQPKIGTGQSTISNRDVQNSQSGLAFSSVDPSGYRENQLSSHNTSPSKLHSSPDTTQDQQNSSNNFNQATLSSSSSIPTVIGVSTINGKQLTQNQPSDNTTDSTNNVNDALTNMSTEGRTSDKQWSNSQNAEVQISSEFHPIISLSGERSIMNSSETKSIVSHRTAGRSNSIPPNGLNSTNSTRTSDDNTSAPDPLMSRGREQLPIQPIVTLNKTSELSSNISSSKNNRRGQEGTTFGGERQGGIENMEESPRPMDSFDASVDPSQQSFLSSVHPDTLNNFHFQPKGDTSFPNPIDTPGNLNAPYPQYPNSVYHQARQTPLSFIQIDPQPDSYGTFIPDETNSQFSGQHLHGKPYIPGFVQYEGTIGLWSSFIPLLFGGKPISFFATKGEPSSQKLSPNSPGFFTSSRNYNTQPGSSLIPTSGQSENNLDTFSLTTGQEPQTLNTPISASSQQPATEMPLIPNNLNPTTQSSKYLFPSVENAANNMTGSDRLYLFPISIRINIPSGWLGGQIEYPTPQSVYARSFPFFFNPNSPLSQPGNKEDPLRSIAPWLQFSTAMPIPRSSIKSPIGSGSRVLGYDNPSEPETPDLFSSDNSTFSGFRNILDRLVMRFPSKLFDPMGTPLITKYGNPYYGNQNYGYPNHDNPSQIPSFSGTPDRLLLSHPTSPGLRQFHGGPITDTTGTPFIVNYYGNPKYPYDLPTMPLDASRIPEFTNNGNPDYYVNPNGGNANLRIPYYGNPNGVNPKHNPRNPSDSGALDIIPLPNPTMTGLRNFPERPMTGSPTKPLDATGRFETTNYDIPNYVKLNYGIPYYRNPSFGILQEFDNPGNPSDYGTLDNFPLPDPTMPSSLNIPKISKTGSPTNYGNPEYPSDSRIPDNLALDKSIFSGFRNFPENFIVGSPTKPIVAIGTPYIKNYGNHQHPSEFKIPDNFPRVRPTPPFSQNFPERSQTGSLNEPFQVSGIPNILVDGNQNYANPNYGNPHYDNPNYGYQSNDEPLDPAYSWTPDSTPLVIPTTTGSQNISERSIKGSPTMLLTASPNITKDGNPNFKHSNDRNPNYRFPNYDQPQNPSLDSFQVGPLTNPGSRDLPERPMKGSSTVTLDETGIIYIKNDGNVNNGDPKYGYPNYGKPDYGNRYYVGQNYGDPKYGDPENSSNSGIQKSIPLPISTYPGSENFPEVAIPGSTAKPIVATRTPYITNGNSENPSDSSSPNSIPLSPTATRGSRFFPERPATGSPAKLYYASEIPYPTNDGNPTYRNPNYGNPYNRNPNYGYPIDDNSQNHSYSGTPDTFALRIPPSSGSHNLPAVSIPGSTAKPGDATGTPYITTNGNSEYPIDSRSPNSIPLITPTTPGANFFPERSGTGSPTKLVDASGILNPTIDHNPNYRYPNYGNPNYGKPYNVKPNYVYPNYDDPRNPYYSGTPDSFALPIPTSSGSRNYPEVPIPGSTTKPGGATGTPDIPTNGSAEYPVDSTPPNNIPYTSPTTPGARFFPERPAAGSRAKLYDASGIPNHTNDGNPNYRNPNYGNPYYGNPNYRDPNDDNSQNPSYSGTPDTFALRIPPSRESHNFPAVSIPGSTPEPVDATGTPYITTNGNSEYPIDSRSPNSIPLITPTTPGAHFFPERSGTGSPTKLVDASGILNPTIDHNPNYRYPNYGNPNYGKPYNGKPNYDDPRNPYYSGTPDSYALPIPTSSGSRDYPEVPIPGSTTKPGDATGTPDIPTNGNAEYPVDSTPPNNIPYTSPTTPGALFFPERPAAGSQAKLYDASGIPNHTNDGNPNYRNPNYGNPYYGNPNYRDPNDDNSQNPSYSGTPDTFALRIPPSRESHNFPAVSIPGSTPEPVDATGTPYITTNGNSEHPIDSRSPNSIPLITPTTPGAHFFPERSGRGSPTKLVDASGILNPTIDNNLNYRNPNYGNPNYGKPYNGKPNYGYPNYDDPQNPYYSGTPDSFALRILTSPGSPNFPEVSIQGYTAKPGDATGTPYITTNGNAEYSVDSTPPNSIPYILPTTPGARFFPERSGTGSPIELFDASEILNIENDGSFNHGNPQYRNPNHGNPEYSSDFGSPDGLKLRRPTITGSPTIPNTLITGPPSEPIHANGRHSLFIHGNPEYTSDSKTPDIFGSGKPITPSSGNLAERPIIGTLKPFDANGIPAIKNDGNPNHLNPYYDNPNYEHRQYDYPKNPPNGGAPDSFLLHNPTMPGSPNTPIMPITRSPNKQFGVSGTSGITNYGDPNQVNPKHGNPDDRNVRNPEYLSKSGTPDSFPLGSPTVPNSPIGSKTELDHQRPTTPLDSSRANDIISDGNSQLPSNSRTQDDSNLGKPTSSGSRHSSEKPNMESPSKPYSSTGTLGVKNNADINYDNPSDDNPNNFVISWEPNGFPLHKSMPLFGNIPGRQPMDLPLEPSDAKGMSDITVDINPNNFLNLYNANPNNGKSEYDNPDYPSNPGTPDYFPQSGPIISGSHTNPKWSTTELLTKPIDSTGRPGRTGYGNPEFPSDSRTPVNFPMGESSFSGPLNSSKTPITVSPTKPSESTVTLNTTDYGNPEYPSDVRRPNDSVLGEPITSGSRLFPERRISALPSPSTRIPDITNNANPDYDNPTYDNPTYDNPTYDNPTYDNPTYDNPTYDNPTYDNQKNPSISGTRDDFPLHKSTFSVTPNFLNRPSVDSPSGQLDAGKPDFKNNDGYSKNGWIPESSSEKPSDFETRNDLKFTMPGTRNFPNWKIQTQQPTMPFDVTGTSNIASNGNPSGSGTPDNFPMQKFVFPGSFPERVEMGVQTSPLGATGTPGTSNNGNPSDLNPNYHDPRYSYPMGGIEVIQPGIQSIHKLYPLPYRFGAQPQPEISSSNNPNTPLFNSLSAEDPFSGSRMIQKGNPTTYSETHPTHHNPPNYNKFPSSSTIEASHQPNLIEQPSNNELNLSTYPVAINSEQPYFKMPSGADKGDSSDLTSSKPPFKPGFIRSYPVPYSTQPTLSNQTGTTPQDPTDGSRSNFNPSTNPLSHMEETSPNRTNPHNQSQRSSGPSSEPFNVKDRTLPVKDVTSIPKTNQQQYTITDSNKNTEEPTTDLSNPMYQPLVHPQGTAIITVIPHSSKGPTDSETLFNPQSNTYRTGQNPTDDDGSRSMKYYPAITRSGQKPGEQSIDFKDKTRPPYDGELPDSPNSNKTDPSSDYPTQSSEQLLNPNPTSHIPLQRSSKEPVDVNLPDSAGIKYNQTRQRYENPGFIGYYPANSQSDQTTGEPSVHPSSNSKPPDALDTTKWYSLSNYPTQSTDRHIHSADPSARIQSEPSSAEQIDNDSPAIMGYRTRQRLGSEEPIQYYPANTQADQKTGEGLVDQYSVDQTHDSRQYNAFSTTKWYTLSKYPTRLTDQQLDSTDPPARIQSEPNSKEPINNSLPDKAAVMYYQTGQRLVNQGSIQYYPANTPSAPHKDDASQTSNSKTPGAPDITEQYPLYNYPTPPSVQQLDSSYSTSRPSSELSSQEQINADSPDRIPIKYYQTRQGLGTPGSIRYYHESSTSRRIHSEQSGFHLDDLGPTEDSKTPVASDISKQYTLPHYPAQYSNQLIYTVDPSFLLPSEPNSKEQIDANSPDGAIKHYRTIQPNITGSIRNYSSTLSDQASYIINKQQSATDTSSDTSSISGKTIIQSLVPGRLSQSSTISEGPGSPDLASGSGSHKNVLSLSNFKPNHPNLSKNLEAEKLVSGLALGGQKSELQADSSSIVLSSERQLGSQAHSNQAPVKTTNRIVTSTADSPPGTFQQYSASAPSDMNSPGKPMSQFSLFQSPNMGTYSGDINPSVKMIPATQSQVVSSSRYIITNATSSTNTTQYSMVPSITSSGTSHPVQYQTITRPVTTQVRYSIVPATYRQPNGARNGLDVTSQTLGEMKPVVPIMTNWPKGVKGSVTRGKYSYSGPDGKTVTTNWYVDETGFHIEGDQQAKTNAEDTKTS